MEYADDLVLIGNIYEDADLLEHENQEEKNEII